MTNENKQPTIKPFCVDMIGEDLTDEQITEMFNLLIKCGAREYDSLEGVLRWKSYYPLFGINDKNMTFHYDELDCVSLLNNIVIIEYEDLRKHLGLVETSTETTSDCVQKELQSLQPSCTTEYKNLSREATDEHKVNLDNKLLSDEVTTILEEMNLTLMYSPNRKSKSYTVIDDLGTEWYLTNEIEFMELVTALKLCDKYMEE